MTSRFRPVILAASATLLLAVSCGSGSDRPFVAGSPTPGTTEVSLKIDSPAAGSAGGNTIALDVTVAGVEIKAADGDTSGDSGHFHVFIDREPVAVGEPIPVEAGIVHSAADPIPIYGLKAGKHTFTVVLGDGTHRRIHEVSDSLELTLTGPSVRASAPATIAAGAAESLTIEYEGFKLVPMGKHSGAHGGEAKADELSGHFHILIDPASPPVGGMDLPDPKDGSVVHTDKTTWSLSDLPAGEHTIYVVAGSATHVAFDPLVAAMVKVKVQ